MPLLFEVMKDPMLNNPNVIVRRTAKQRAPHPYHQYYLSIEFNWLQSGALGVVTNITSVDSDEPVPSGRCPFALSAEHRIFSPQTASRLCAVADQLSVDDDLAFFPHRSHIVGLPPDFANPPDDYYILSVKESDEPLYCAMDPLTFSNSTKTQVFDVEKDFELSSSTANSTSTTTTTSNTSQTDSINNTNPIALKGNTTTSLHGGAPLHCNEGNVSSVAEAGTVKLWKRYQDVVAQSRRAGNIVTMLGSKMGGRFAKEVPVYGRDARYLFLSKSGINVHGRIQLLCTQLSIEFGSPVPGPNAKLWARYLQCASSGNSGSVVGQAVDISAYARTLRGISGDEQVDDIGNWGKSEQFAQAVRGAHHERLRIEAGRGSSSVSGQARSDKGDREPLGSDTERIRKRRRTIDVAEGTGISTNRNAPTSPTLSEGIQLLTEAPSDSLTHPVHYVKQEQSVGDAAFSRPCDLGNPLPDSNSSITGKLPASSNGQKPSRAASSVAPTHQLNDQKEKDPITGSTAAANSFTEPVPRKKDDKLPKDSVQKTVWTCDRCGQKIRGKKGNLNRHIANKHDNIRAYECSWANCDRKFQTRLNLVRHETAVHVGRPHTCPSCPRAFKNEGDMAAHVKAAHENPQFSLACNVCGSCFGRRSTLNRHMAKVHKIENKVEHQGASVAT